jgi:hypothetical protein
LQHLPHSSGINPQIWTCTQNSDGAYLEAHIDNLAGDVSSPDESGRREHSRSAESRVMNMDWSWAVCCARTEPPAARPYFRSPVLRFRLTLRGSVHAAVLRGPRAACCTPPQLLSLRVVAGLADHDLSDLRTGRLRFLSPDPVQLRCERSSELGCLPSLADTEVAVLDVLDNTEGAEPAESRPAAAVHNHWGSRTYQWTRSASQVCWGATCR